MEPAHLEAEKHGDLVQVDCFHIGRLTGTEGRVWQYTAVDVASSFSWASLHVTPLNPAARHSSEVVRRLAQQLAEAGCRLKAISTENAFEFRSEEQRVQRTLLEECYRAASRAGWCPNTPPCRRDLVSYPDYYNFDRAHTGRKNQGRPPAGPGLRF